VSASSRYCILGPHPGNHSYSTVKYFNFCRRHLPQTLGCRVQARCPARGFLPTDDALPNQDRTEIWWQTYALWPGSLFRLKSDCFHIIDQGLFWYSRFLRGGRRLGTVNDLIAYMSLAGSLPFAVPVPRKKFLIQENIRQLRKLDHVISPSRFTADCLMREVGIPAARITVIPYHVDTGFTPVVPAEREQNRLKWFGTVSHAILHVGAPTVYKNRPGVIRAFSVLREKLPEAHLFCVGGAATADERKLMEDLRCSSCVTFLPAVSVAELREIYTAADVLVFPSFYEGFGWPPLEAMASGCPVVSSTRASLREVVADAALTVDDPHDNERIASLLAEVLTDPRCAADLTRRGLARAACFSPEKSLNEVAGIYRMLA